MAATFLKVLKSAFVIGYGLFTLVVYGAIATANGYFFRRSSEKENLELKLGMYRARNRLWNLSKKWSTFSHQILTLKNGFKFHYVCNDSNNNTATRSLKPLVIFIHGFPDSWAIWRRILTADALQHTATVVAVDLPGYGGSDSLERYSATKVLENLTEFIIAVRAKYGIDSETETSKQRTIIVAHDWGCVLSMRLAAEAPQLADRFILTNGPLISLVVSNIQRLLSSSLKMFRTFLSSPIRSRSLLYKAAKPLKTLLQQIWLSGYIFAMHLPSPLVKYLGFGGNYSFLKLVHKMSYGDQEFSPADAAECMASTLGPSVEEGGTRTDDGEAYPPPVRNERARSNFFDMASYYRDGTAVSRWRKSINTITSLHRIAKGVEFNRVNSGTGLFDDGPTGAMKARATIIWGKADSALNPQLCLDGISDYLVGGSQVIELPRSGHFTPLERESRLALIKAVEWAIKGEKEDIWAVVRACYPEATTMIRK